MKMDLSPTQKANIRKRLKAADDVVMKIQQSGVECNALVNDIHRPTSLSHIPLDTTNKKQ